MNYHLTNKIIDDKLSTSWLYSSSIIVVFKQREVDHAAKNEKRYSL